MIYSTGRGEPAHGRTSSHTDFNPDRVNKASGPDVPPSRLYAVSPTAPARAGTHSTKQTPTVDTTAFFAAIRRKAGLS